MKALSVVQKQAIVSPSGNWNVAKDYFPEIEVDQETGVIEVTLFYTRGHQDKASIDTTLFEPKVSADKTQVLISGEVDCKNWRNYKCSGSQKFCFAVFEGDSGHIYVHRAPATKGWLEADPNKLRKRLVKLGIGAVSNVLQQGDFLLKPANGNSLPVEAFKHEWTSASHHKFSEPVLSEYAPGVGRIVYIPEGRSVELHHEAVDGIQHPMIVVPSGQWIIGSTASQLVHTNKRD